VPALPDQFSLDTQLVLGKAGTVMLCYAVSLWRANTSAEVWPGFDWQSDQFVVSVGVVESAIREEQVPFNLFEHTDHIGVFGDTLSGKTSLLQTIFTSLTTSYRPNEVNFFLLDLNGNSFANFEQFPHVLALLSVDHPDFDSQVVHWFEGLGEQVERRQQLLTASGHADIYSYNRQHSEYSLPIIVVMIDDLAVLQQGHQSLLEKTLVVLTLRMLPLGMHLVITEQHPDVLPKRLFNLLKQRISFFQREQRLYRTIFAQDLPELPKVPGYAYSKHHSNLLLLRTALPLSDVSVVASSATFKEIGDRMTIYWDEHFGLAPEKRLTLEGILNRIETMQAIIIAAMREQFATSGTSPLAEHFAQLTPLQWYDPTALMGLITMLAANDKLSTLSETALLQYYRNRYTI
jgi:DNA segregation ATPase FtsK/SpoIIIE, S-DNA-T family